MTPFAQYASEKIKPKPCLETLAKIIKSANKVKVKNK